MKPILFSILTLTACATTSSVGGPDHDVGPRSGVQLKLVPSIDAGRVFPAAIDPALPSADPFAHQIRMKFGDSMLAELDLCVAPSGVVTSAKLVETTGFPALDVAIERDAAAWRFEPMPGPDHVKNCERAQVTYVAP